ncbi:phosphatidylinositol-4,5-diphosphate 3-kinase [Heterostelium album PN500]|uniref:phosphatidylinositol 3-kinase n=1 Tax=Heterostelium pallidum (strain ATCC 26659 / Pp 5 / PN500) TaxID=670386 RepID=D3AYR9_HETP5|nr:phosphatidylinositol-4,5-diphosphate 3-kinase [Heterostelium album PN500]EFA86096.1 phosphatidylinositol-4,5-diphosphate 3-kinase [Heterostelium album PN500]|eukprot:XP_020438202.1 phosphatidylinositol-4,5-diphosphate 3-kinase [Heterostelium album PN500]
MASPEIKLETNSTTNNTLTTTIAATTSTINNSNNSNSSNNNVIPQEISIATTTATSSTTASMESSSGRKTSNGSSSLSSTMAASDPITGQSRSIGSASEDSLSSSTSSSTSSTSTTSTPSSPTSDAQQPPTAASAASMSITQDDLNKLQMRKDFYSHTSMEYLKRNGSLLNLERKGLVKEISAKFQTPDTASYTRLNPNTHISIKERIINLKKENEKKTKDTEMTKRETVIKLVDDHEVEALNSSPLTHNIKDRLYGQDLIKEQQQDNDKETTVLSSSTSTSLNSSTNSSPQTPLSPNSTSSTSSSSSSLSLKGSKIYRRRRGRNAVAPSQHDINMMNLNHFLNIPPNPIQLRAATPNQPLSSPTKDFLKKILEVHGNEVGDVANYQQHTTGSSPDQSNAETPLRMRVLKSSFKLLCILPNHTTTTLVCKGLESIENVRDRLVQHLQQSTSSQSVSLNADAYVIVDIKDRPIDNILLSKSEYIQNRRARGLLPKLKMIEKYQLMDPDASSELNEAENDVIKLILPNVRSWHGEEVDHFRQIAARLRYELLPDIKGTVHSSLTVRLSPLPLPATVTTTKILISIFLPILQVTRTVEIDVNETADDLISRVFTRNYSKHLPNVSPNDFILKVMGRAEYVHGPHVITTFEYIRQCIVQGVKTQLVYVQRPPIELDVAPFKPRYEFQKEFPLKYHIESARLTWDQMTHISSREVKRPVRIKALAAYNIASSYLSKDDDISVILSMSLYHGIELISQTSTRIQTLLPLSYFASTPASQSINFNEQVTFPSIDYCNLPIETRLCISLYASSNTASFSSNTAPELENQKQSFPIGWVNIMLFDHNRQLRTGPVTLHLWPDDIANPLSPCSSNPQNSVALFLEFEQFSMPVVFPTVLYNTISATTPPITKDIQDFFDSIIRVDPLSDLSREKYQQLWSLRQYAIHVPQILPRLMLSVPWTNPAAVDEIHSLISRWPRLTPYDALALLDAKNVDYYVRTYAVHCLDALSEEELLDILLQLIQVLKSEPFHDSPLSRFLLKRAILSRTIGHHFFWYLKADLHVTNIAERFGLLLESYLQACGSHREEMGRQLQVIDSLTAVARKIKPLKDQDRREVMLKELEKIEWPKRFQITLNPKFESNGLINQRCKYMDSKKLPLRLSFTNIDMGADTTEVIFKVGDDLRQDMLTLQMIRLMDKLWQKEGLDFKLSPYGCIATGDMIGMIEVVLNSETTAKIQKSAGGATAAFKLDPLANWLLQHNKTEQEYQKAVDTFILSCAGYCVATYVLGIGDRHNDNLMCTKLGRLFHIDFGHFLGNYKKKFGFKRERAPFVFTPDFCYVMGGKDSAKFLQFVNYCCNAYNILRRHARLFMNLFAMMVSTGIPELQSMEDLNYLRESFSLELTDEKAREKFTALIYESLTTKTTQLNNAIHILAH